MYFKLLTIYKHKKVYNFDCFLQIHVSKNEK